MSENAVRVEGASPTSGALPVSIVPATTSAANVLSGGVQVDNSVTSTAFLTVPAGRTWVGSVAVCGSNADTTQTLATSRVVTAGTGVTPAAGTIIASVISRRDVASPTMALDKVYVVAPAGNSVTLELVNSRATTYSGTASASGVLL